MSFLTKRPGRKASVAGAVVLAAGILIGYAGGGIAGSGGLPADKTSVAGSGIEDIDPTETHEILSTRMAVSSPSDLILGVTAECSILTRLVTDTDKETATAEGSVVLHITVDGKVVPVQTAPTKDDGRVTFCNRTYQRTVTDTEANSPMDGIDKEDDYIRTKAANAFNWVALNVGTAGYDNPLNGNNVLDIRVFATYVRTNPTANSCPSDTTANLKACSEAYVGKRTLVIEPVHAANREQSEPTGAPPIGAGGL
jgi:hypothetical protein